MPERNTPRRRALHRMAALASACALGAGPVRARRDLPRRIRLVVPQAPGGTSDLVARVLGERLEAELDVPVVIENRPGANGMIAAEFVARAAPDGSTLLVASTATHAMAPHLASSPHVDLQRDFVAIAPIALQTKLFLASHAVPATSLASFVAYARARPGALNYASVGVGTSSHVDTELFARLAGLDLVHVPYRGSAQAVQALVANEVQVLLASMIPAMPAVDAGQVRALAILAERRSPLLPAVPTIAEAGWPIFDVRTWIGVVAPRGTPAANVDLVHAAVARATAAPAMRAWMDAQGLEPLAGTPASFDATLRADHGKWGRVIRELGLAPG
jgi:tripartite-type tricarboxylate transporter receptor subunit TctC